MDADKIADTSQAAWISDFHQSDIVRGSSDWMVTLLDDIVLTSLEMIQDLTVPSGSRTG